MGAELGATTSIFPYDERMAALPARHPAAANWPTWPRPTATCWPPTPRWPAAPAEVLRPHRRDRPLAAWSRTWSGRTRRTSRARSAGSAAECRERGLARERLRGPDRQLHQQQLRGHLPRRRRGPAGAGQGPEDEDAAAGLAGLGPDLRDHQARRPARRARGGRRHRADQRLRPLHRPVAARRHARRASPTASSPRSTATSRSATTATRRPTPSSAAPRSSMAYGLAGTPRRSTRCATP